MQIDRKQLQEALTDAFTGIASFSQLLFEMNRSWDTFAGEGTTLPQGITEVIAKAIAESWLPDLLKAVEASSAKNNPKFRAFIAAHPNLDPIKTPRKQNPLESNFLLANRPFVGRPKLRQHLGKLGGPQESRILMVDGSRGCGKSYTHSFLEFAATYWQPSHVHRFDLDRQAFTLDQLARWLQEDLSLPLPVPLKDQEQDARWAERLAGWVVNSTANRPGATWLLFDGFRLQEHERGVYDFVDKMGEMIDNTAASRCSHLRLVLINYEARVPEAVAVGALEERVQAPERKEFEDCFVRLLVEQHDMTPELARAAFEDAYGQAETKAQTDPEGQEVTRLRYVNLALTRAVKRLLT